MKNRIWAWLVLGVITLGAGLGLAITNQVTKGPIEQQAIASEEAARLQVMPGAASFEEILLEGGGKLFAAKDGEGNLLGYIGKAEKRGYGGPVEVIAGVKADGSLTGINVGGSSFAETPGLGAKARDEGFAAQFVGKQSPVRLGDKKQDNAVDALTAATITSNAVLGAVNEVAKQVKLFLNPDADKPAGVAEGTPYFGEAVGFAGANNPVYVVVTIKEDGSITGLKVGDERFKETEGYGAAALEPDFAKQFVGKTPPLAIRGKDEAAAPGNIDAIGGATVTSKAVIAAINQAYESKSVLLPEGTTYAGEAVGFAGANNPVYVQVTIKEDGSISALKIGDERFKETEGYGAAALEPDFAAQFIGKQPPLVIRGADEAAAPGNIDAIGGATLTTKAVLEAINSAIENKKIISESAASTTPETQQEPAAAAGQPVTVTGFMGPITLTATFNPDGSIKGIEISEEGFKETRGYGSLALKPEFAQGLIGKLPPLAIRQPGQEQSQQTVDKLMDADTNTSATITLQAILDAINKACENSK